VISLINQDFFEVDLDDKINLGLVDPPYGISYKDWDWKQKDFKSHMRRTMDKLMLHMDKYGTIWFFMGYTNLFTHKGCEEGLVNILEEYGTVHLENMVTWMRMKGRGSSKKLKSLSEFIIHFTVHPTNYTWNNIKVLREVICPYVKDGRPRGWWINEKGMRVRWTGTGNVWLYSSPQWNGILDHQIHSAQKPFLMYERLIKLSSNIGDNVIDPYAGSATSAIVSKFLDRNYLGIEKDEKIFRKAKDNYDNRYSVIIEEYNKFKTEALSE